jgi:tetratricopeptide (TPR) repeat protein
MRTFALAAVLVACSPPPASAPPKAPAAPATATAPAAHVPLAEDERFDFKVRADFFDGLRGDTAALDRAIKLCEETLAQQPNHPEAMVWHGAGMLGRASMAFRSGDSATGMTLYDKGLGEMDRAVELAPRSVGVRIPRGAVLLSMAPFVPEPEKSRLLARGVGDYETTLAVQAPYFDKLTLHAREQLLYGLTDGYANLGDMTKAQAYYQRMTTDAAGSPLIARAKARAAGESVDGRAPCEQCHGR